MNHNAKDAATYCSHKHLSDAYQQAAEEKNFFSHWLSALRTSKGQWNVHCAVKVGNLPK